MQTDAAGTVSIGAARLRGVRRALVALRVVHPFPTLANALATLLMGLIASRGSAPAGRLLLIALTMLAIQCAIGATNDAVDAPLDAASKPWKPIVAGALSRRAAAVVAMLAALVGMLLAATAGPAAGALAVLGLACGIAYDLRLKRSPLAPLPYLLAFVLYPLWVWTALGRFTAALLWEAPLALLLGAALYLGNTAPDLAADQAAGVRGLAHRLGLRRTLVLCWLGFAVALGAATPIAALAGYRIELVAGASAFAAAPSV